MGARCVEASSSALTLLGLSATAEAVTITAIDPRRDHSGAVFTGSATFELKSQAGFTHVGVAGGTAGELDANLVPPGAECSNGRTCTNDVD